MPASRVWGSLAILAALGIAAWAVLESKDGAPVAGDLDDEGAELAALEAENAWLREQLQRLRERRDLEAEEARKKREGPELEGAGPARPPEKQHEPPPSPERLIQGLRSALKARKGNAQDVYRLSLQMAGRPAVAALLEVLRDPRETDAMRAEALALLQKLRAPEVSQALLELLSEEGTPAALRMAALQRLVLPAGAAVPPIVEQLAMDPDTDLDTRAAALRVLVTAQPHEAAQEVRRLLASGDGDERKHGFSLLQRARDPVFRPIVEEAIEHAETPSEIRPLLDALAAFKGKKWATYQMTGPPDTPIAGDIGTAWASKNGDMGEVWVELDYRYSVVPNGVRIHETYGPGAVKKILAKQPGGAWAVLWEGTAPRGEAPRWFEPAVAHPEYRTNTIRIVLDTNRVAGWNELDAVELIGDGSRQWAVKARASSSYAGE